MSLEMAHKVIVLQKKIMPRSFLNIATLIVIKVFSPKSAETCFLILSLYVSMTSSFFKW
jgi:hypothetical protein